MKKLLEELFSAYYKDIYGYLYSLCHDAHLAEDLASEAFLEVVKSVAAFRGESDIKTWLFTIARRRWFAWLKQKQRQPQWEALSEFLPDHTPLPEEQLARAELRQRIQALLAREPQRTQTILQMRLEGYSFYEIAQSQGISESSARVIDFRAKSKIRTALIEEGFTHE